MPESINSKLKEQYDHDDSGGSLDTNLGDFLDSEGASGTSNNSKWRDWASGTGTSLNTRLFHKHGGSGSFMTRWKNWIAFSSTHSFNFDGSNDYLDCGNSTGIQFSGSFSVSFWFNTTDATATNEILVSKANDGVNDGWLIRLNSSRKLEFVVLSGVITDSGSASNDGNWHHVLAVHESGVGNRLYKNGSLVASNSTGTDLSNHVPNLHIGNQDYSTSRAINSLIDEVAVWNTALSASDVTSIYNNGKVIDLSKSASYGTDRTGNLKLWLRCGDKAEPESTTAIARQDFYTDFDGTDDYIDTGTTIGTSLGDNYSGGLSASAWINVSSSYSSGEKGILFIGNFGGSYGEFTITITPTTLVIYLNQNAWQKSISFTARDIWTHICYVVDSEDVNNTKFYIDGISQSLTNINNTYPSSGDLDFSGLKTVIGNFFNGNYPFHGKISNLAIYKTALDAQTISQMAKSRFTPMRDNRFSVVDFDGSNDYISLGDLNRSMNVDGNSTTISTWVNLDANNATYNIFEQGISTSGNVGERILLWHTSGSRFATYANSTGLGTTATVAGVWYHVAMTINSSDSNIRLYVNGVLENTTSYTKYTNDLNVAEIGRVPYDGSNELNGQISSLSIYDVAKSDEEVYAIYQQGITYDESSLSGLVGYWRMGDDTSKAYPTIADSSSNSNDGTITNGASDDIVQQMVAGYDLGAFESSTEELSGEIVQDSSFELSGEQSAGTSGTYYNLDSEVSISNGQLISNATSSTTTTIVGGMSVEQGKVYKIEIVVASGSSNANISITNSNNSVATGFIAYSEGSNIVYYTPSATTTLSSFKGANGSRVWTIDSFSFKEVLQSEVSDTYPAIIDVNEPVLGVELVDNNTSSGWSAYGSNTVANVTNGVKITHVDNAGGGQGDFTDAKLLNATTTSGKIYKVKFNAYYSGGTAPNVKIWTGSETAGIQALNTTETEHIIYYVATGSTASLFFDSVNGSQEIYILNLSTKEIQGNVGTMTNQDSADLVYSSVLPDQSFLTGVNSAYNFLDFDGTDAKVTLSSQQSLTADFTISGWMNRADEDLKVFFGDSNSGTKLNYLFITETTKNLGIDFQGLTAIEFSNSNPPHSEWFHFAITRNAKIFKCYVNGSLTDTEDKSSAGAYDQTWTYNQIGTYFSGSYWIDASFSNFAIHNKELIASEISAIYTAGRHTNLLDSYSDNLKGYYAFGALDSKTGLPDTDSTIYDRSGNSNHGTTSGTATGDLKSPPNAQPEGYAKQDVNRSTTTP